VASFEVERRRLTVGISQLIVGSELPALLRQMSEHDPHLLLELRVAGSREVMQAYEEGTLDLHALIEYRTPQLMTAPANGSAATYEPTTLGRLLFNQALSAAWTVEPTRFLDRSWFVSEVRGFRAISISQAPAAFRRRGVFIPERSLRRV